MTTRTTEDPPSKRREARCCLRGRCSFRAAGERHDLVGGHPNGTLTTQPRNDALAATAPPARLANPDRLSVDLELDLGIREQTELLANGLGDGDLPF